MTSKAELNWTSEPGKRRRGSLDQPPPPPSSNKPLTPFSIEDILRKPCGRRNQSVSGAAFPVSPGENAPSAGHILSAHALLSQSSPLCALQELTSKTFKGLEDSVLQAAEGRDGVTLFGQRTRQKKRRKSRTAFTNHQIFELEKRFLYQKYLSPADRDQLSQHLGLTSAQVITWFQNRRAKLKRDLEEMKADVESAKAAGSADLKKLTRAKLVRSSPGGPGGVSTPAHTMQDRVPPTAMQTPSSLDPTRSHISTSPAELSQNPDRMSRFSSEDEDEDIDVND
ncbi:transcription factor LBX1-like [Melanotaenia boesemani]|uniref:transcription factor LBX1-like n=1 Tax=Melanotaenia boesemani TaxID=1250792 RepID=UPI001C05158A|nr:transcription factor LBX1-like [Melanotaenia boesemani]